MNSAARFAAMQVSQERLVQMVREHQDFITTWLADQPTAYPPQLLVLTRASPKEPEAMQLFSLLVPFNEEQDKFAILQEVGRGIYELHTFPLAAVFYAEAWLSVRDADAPAMQPRHDPQRQEVVIVVGMTLLGDCCASCQLPIRRGPQEEILAETFGEIRTADVGSRLLSQLFIGFRNAAKRLKRTH